MIDFGLANSADPDEMAHYVAFSLGDIFTFYQSTHLGVSGTQRGHILETH